MKKYIPYMSRPGRDIFFRITVQYCTYQLSPATVFLCHEDLVYIYYKNIYYVNFKIGLMGFEPLINVLKSLISNHSHSEGWVANDGKLIPDMLLRNKSIL